MMGPGRFQTGTILSGILHAGLILWVLLGDWLFGRSEPRDVMPTQVSMISSAEFAELQATTASPSDVDTGREGAVSEEPTPAEVPEQMSAPPARPEPTPAPEAEPEPSPEPEAEPAPAPEPEPEPAPVPEPTPVPQEAPPEAPAEVVPMPPVEPPPVPVITNSTRPKPRPADRVAPNPNVAPPEAVTAPTPEPAVSETPSETPTPPQEAREETVPEDSGDVLRTEATEEQEAPGGMQASPRPKPRPNKPAPRETPAAERPAANNNASSNNASSSSSSSNAAAEQAAIDAALAEAAGSASSSSSSSSSSGGRNAPVGPPLNAGEIGGISSAIGNKWNLGAASTEVMQTMVVIRVEFDQNGRPGNITLVESTSPSAAAEKVAFDAARRAVQRAYQDGGIPLPADKYDTWRVLEFVFDANGMRMR